MSGALTGSWSLVTGASSGIGWALARELAARGSDLVLVARDRRRLEEAASTLVRERGVRVEALPADLATPEAPARLAGDLEKLGVHVDVLVNNAGVGVWGDFAETAFEDERRLLALNVEAYMALAKAMLPGMRARRRGWLLNVASTAGFFPGPRMAAYYASKAFVVSFSQALAKELEGSGVSVTCLCPGPVRTRFAEGEDTRLFHTPLLMDADRVARAAIHGMLAGRRIVVPGFLTWMLIEAGRVTPRRLAESIVAFLNRPAGRR